MNNLKRGIHKKLDLKINKKQLLIIICMFFCFGFSLFSIGIFGLIRYHLVVSDTSSPDESTSDSSFGDSLLSSDSLYSEIDETTSSVTDLSTQLESTTTATQSKQAEPTSTYSNKLFENIASLNGSCINWGQGTKFDEQNRPIYALSNQKKYGKYNADFIRDDSKKDLYLTFDEGYENGCTSKILDVLKEKQVPAVFFVTKPYAKSSPDLVKRMIAEGHIVGNHSVTHPSGGLPSQTLEEQTNEFMGCHDYVKENFNYTMNLFRFPSGKFSEQSLALANNCNYRSVFWSFAYLDYDVNHQMDEKQALDLLTARLHPGAIYLLHAVSKTNADILGNFIDKARAAGYVFMPYQ